MSESVRAPWTTEQWVEVCEYGDRAEAAVESILNAHIWLSDENRCMCRQNFNKNAHMWHVAREITAFDLSVDAPPLLAPEWLRPSKEN